MALFVTVTGPPQLSIAVGGVRLVTEHDAVTFGNERRAGVGPVLSLITTFCVCVDVLPLPSSYVHVTTVVPCVVIGSVALFVTVIKPGQLSVALGVVKDVTEH